MWGRILALVAGAKKSSLPKPVEVRRPGDKPKVNVLSIAEFAAAHGNRTEQ